MEVSGNGVHEESAWPSLKRWPPVSLIALNKPPIVGAPAGRRPVFLVPAQEWPDRQP
jgi:hypothetical protein